MTAKQSYYTGLYSSNHYLPKLVKLSFKNSKQDRHISNVAAQAD